MHWPGHAKSGIQEDSWQLGQEFEPNSGDEEGSHSLVLSRAPTLRRTFNLRLGPLDLLTFLCENLHEFHTIYVIRSNQHENLHD